MDFHLEPMDIKVEEGKEHYYINKRIFFKPMGIVSKANVEATFKFAYDMTFGGKGVHRDHRSGGHHQRRLGEIFADAFQGKLAEFAIIDTLAKHGVQVPPPDLETYGEGQWDLADLVIGGRMISIKSTKAIGNLFLLETKDWDEEGRYLPSDTIYRYHFMVRLRPFGTELMKKNKLLYSDEANRDTLAKLIMQEKWEYDIPGYINILDLKKVIACKQIIPQGAILSKKTPMDAENYYVQAGSLRGIDRFVEKYNESKQKNKS